MKTTNEATVNFDKIKDDLIVKPKNEPILRSAKPEAAPQPKKQKARTKPTYSVFPSAEQQKACKDFKKARGMRD